MDGMITVHRDYAKRLEQQCLLTSKLDPIHQAVISVFDLALAFMDAYELYGSQAPPKIAETSITRAHYNREIASTHRRRASSISSYDSVDEDEKDQDKHAEAHSGTTYLCRLKKFHATFANEQTCLAPSLGCCASQNSYYSM